MAVYGLDIGGTKIEAAIFDDDLNLQNSWRVDTPVTNYNEFLKAVQELVTQADQLCGEQGKLGIGMPGLITSRGKTLSSNIPCATGKYVVEDLRQLLNRPIVIQNDTRCFALSEAKDGAGSEYSRVFGAIIGTGAAGGFCINGHLDVDTQGLAGEYGHLPLPADIQQQYQLPLFKCGCGLMACVESYISGPGISRLYHYFSGETISPKQWAKRLTAQDENAQQVLNCYLDISGSTFATVTKLIGPDVIVLGGGVSLVDQILDNLEQAISKYLFNGFSSPVVKRALFGDSSGVRGAALLGAQNNQ